MGGWGWGGERGAAVDDALLASRVPVLAVTPWPWHGGETWLCLTAGQQLVGLHFLIVS